MLALRILVVCSVALLVISLLGYSFTRNQRWLGFALNTLKVSIALGVLLLIAQISMRFIV
jgi:hypothetical protein